MRTFRDGMTIRDGSTETTNEATRTIRDGSTETTEAIRTIRVGGLLWTGPQRP